MCLSYTQQDMCVLARRGALATSLISDRNMIPFALTERPCQIVDLLQYRVAIVPKIVCCSHAVARSRDLKFVEIRRHLEEVPHA